MPFQCGSSLNYSRKNTFSLQPFCYVQNPNVVLADYVQNPNFVLAEYVQNPYVVLADYVQNCNVVSADYVQNPNVVLADYRIIPNKRTTPNKRPPPLFHVPCISAGLKKSTRHQPSACSCVNMVEPRSACCERGCKRSMLLLHVA